MMRHLGWSLLTVIVYLELAAAQPAPAPAPAPAPTPTPAEPAKTPEELEAEARAKADLEKAENEKAEKEKAEKAKAAAASITPYGVMVFDGWYNTGAMANADVPLTATTPAVGNEASIGATARQSRFGIKVQTPAVATALGAKSVEGTFEIDFFGGYYPTNNNSWVNQLLPRLRLYNVAVVFEKVKLVAGQDWMLFAPVIPDSIHHMELPALSNTGNLWSRFPQLSVHATLGSITAAFGVLAPADSTPTGTAPVTVLRDPGAADKSLLPSLQGRIAFNRKLAGAAVAVGASGHVGGEKVAGDAAMMIDAHDVTSWGAAADLVITFGKVSLKGEYFLGANLDPFFSNASIAGPPGMQEPTPVRGYWAQLGLRQAKLGVFVAYGAENPEAPDTSHPLPAGAISRNSAINVALTWIFAPKLVAGVEVDYIDSNRVGTPSQTETHVAATVQYGF